jgi:hypothetical protein
VADRGFCGGFRHTFTDLTSYAELRSVSLPISSGSRVETTQVRRLLGVVPSTVPSTWVIALSRLFAAFSRREKQWLDFLAFQTIFVRLRISRARAPAERGSLPRFPDRKAGTPATTAGSRRRLRRRSYLIVVRRGGSSSWPGITH